MQVQQLVQQCGPGIASLAAHLGLISATDALANRDNCEGKSAPSSGADSEEQLRA